MPDAPAYLLDTNVLIHYARASSVGQAIESRFGFQASSFKPLVCVVTMGEIMAFGRHKAWGPEKWKQLQRLTDNIVRVGIDSDAVLDAYAEIHKYKVDHGHALGDNDVWIAAATKATGAVLLTTDHDFDALCPHLIQRTYIDPHG
jgi:predicted nucleic acid-binding protein